MVYSISEAVMFLRKTYGEESMPSSEETLRRAVRTGELKVQESGDPGRKGYSIDETDLREYAEKRLNRLRARRMSERDNLLKDAGPASGDFLTQFPELYNRFISGQLTPEKYYMALFNEKLKWEKQIRVVQENLAKLELERQSLKNEIMTCQSAIEAYEDGIKKFTPLGGSNR